MDAENNNKRTKIDTEMDAENNNKRTKMDTEIDAENNNKRTKMDAETSGEGLPYAPENWPMPGDVWGWRAGRRVATTGHFLDRYLYAPMRLSRTEKSSSNRKQRICFPSKLSVERYIKTEFPENDVDEFFALFSWKIPAVLPAPREGNLEPIVAVPLQQVPPSESSTLDFKFDPNGCKVKNKDCNSLILEKAEKNLPVLPCDICCAEPGFCRECCCILCCKTVDSAYGGYSYIKCCEKIGNKFCGHVAHMECALRCYLAGTVGGSIELNTEYHCRRCDGRTDLIPHVKKLLHTCKTIDSRVDIEKMLNLGACLLRDTKNTIAKEMLSCIELAYSKLKSGTLLEDIWKVEANGTACSAVNGDAAMEDVAHEHPLDVRRTDSYSLTPKSLILEIEIDEVLQNLVKSQELEYKIVEESLHTQKDYLKDLYEQLNTEKVEMGCQQLSSGGLSYTVRKREEQIKHAIVKFEEMKKVANGFGKTPKYILKEHFGLEIAED